MRPRPAPGDTLDLAWETSSASWGSTTCTRSTVAPAGRTSSRLRAWSTAARKRGATAGGPQARPSATPPSRGPLLQRPRAACVTIPRASSFGAVWSTRLARVKPCASWRIPWAGRSTPGSRAPRLSLWTAADGPQGAARGSLAPHWPRQGMSRHRARRMSDVAASLTAQAGRGPVSPRPGAGWDPRAGVDIGGVCSHTGCVGGPLSLDASASGGEAGPSAPRDPGRHRPTPLRS
jgi:hypothetical protein